MSCLNLSVETTTTLPDRIMEDSTNQCYPNLSYHLHDSHWQSLQEHTHLLLPWLFLTPEQVYSSKDNRLPGLQSSNPDSGALYEPGPVKWEAVDCVTMANVQKIVI